VEVAETADAKTIDAETAEMLKEQSELISAEAAEEGVAAESEVTPEVVEPEGPEEAVEPEVRERPRRPGRVLPAEEMTEQEVEPETTPEEEPAETAYLPALMEPGMADKLISVDFVNVDIMIVLKTFSEMMGINFLVDSKVTGNVTLISPTKIRLADAYQVLESILEVNGFAAVPSGKVVKIIQRTEAPKRNLLTRVGSDPDEIPVEDTVVTQIMPLQYADATEMRNLIQPLISTGAQLSTYDQTNSIVLTDTSSNIHHIAKIIREFDAAGIQEELAVIPLQYASAQVLSQQIAQILEPTQRATATATVTTTPGARVVRARPVVRTQVTPAGTALKILPDDRTNSLIVLANRRDIELIRELVDQLDIERPLEAGNIHVIYLKHATAEELVESLTKAVEKAAQAGAQQQVEPVQLTADESTNALIITATPQDYKVIEDMVRQLDIVREQVLVELRIYEATEDVLKDIGIEWATLDQAVSDSIRGFGFTDFGIRLESASGTLEGLAVGAFRRGPDDTVQIGAILKLLEGHSGVDILSTPHVLTTNHTEAVIKVVENIPFVTQSRITEDDPAQPTVIQTFEYRDVGIELTIVPHITTLGDEKLVRLDVQHKFEKVIEGAPGLGPETPTTARREAETVVSMLSGHTVAIGGLMRDDTVTTHERIPFFGDIPLIGWAFKRKRDRILKTNLLLFITPYVLASPEDLEEMTARKESEAQGTNIVE
jgi:general secretion pathway protein D